MVHRAAAAPKIVAVLVFAFAVVATPREAFWAFGLHALLVATVAATAGISLGFMVRRLALEAPFLVFALMLPFVVGGPEVQVAGIGLSQEGLLSAWNILGKALISGAALLVLAATTTMAELLRGLERLRAPRLLVMMMGFMVRYVDVISGEFHRMSTARAARCGDERWLWRAKAWTASAGTIFIRSFERGERVHLAMLARGYTGNLPASARSFQAEVSAPWPAVAVFPLAALAIAVAAGLT